MSVEKNEFKRKLKPMHVNNRQDGQYQRSIEKRRAVPLLVQIKAPQVATLVTGSNQNRRRNGNIIITAVIVAGINTHKLTFHTSIMMTVQRLTICGGKKRR
jgi:hypothetical protein